MTSTIRRLFDALVSRSHREEPPRTRIHSIEFVTPKPFVVEELDPDVIRANEGEMWQPPEPARRDGRRPRSDHW